MSGAIRIVVADDEPDLRLLLRMQLSQQDGMVVVDEAEDGAEAVAAVERSHATAVVMDLLMPGVSGFEGISELQRDHPDVAIVAYTAVAGEFVRSEMQRLGVELVLKSGNIAPLSEALRRAAGSRERTG